MKVVGIISLGCCKNLTDSENILGVLKSENVVFSSQINKCDLIIINTCGFIENAKQEAMDTINECYQKKKKHHYIYIITITPQADLQIFKYAIKMANL